MFKFNKDDSLFYILEKVIGEEGDGVQIKLEDSDLLNLATLKIIKEELDKRGKRVSFRLPRKRAKILLSALGESKFGDERQARRAFPRISLSLPSIRVPSLVLYAFISFFSLSLIIGGAALWVLTYLPRAEVRLVLKDVPLSKTVEVLGSGDFTQVDLEKRQVPGRWVEVERSGKKQADATGTKTIGDRAKGSVTFVNCTNDPITFSSGTVVKQEGGDKKYSLDSNVTVAAKPSPNSCGTQSADITAAQIGQDYNQSEGAEFDFVGYSYADPLYEIYIAPGQSVSGGYSEQVTVVTFSDQEAVFNSLRDELYNQAREEFGASESSASILPESFKEEVINRTFSADPGQQVKNFELTLTVKYKTLEFELTDLTELAKNVFEGEIPAGYKLVGEKVNVEALGGAFEDKTLKFVLRVYAAVVPAFDVEKLKTDIAGRDVGIVQNYLSSYDLISSYEVKLWPRLPQLLRRIPQNRDRIKVVLEEEGS